MDPNATLERMRAAQHSLRTRQASDPDHVQAFSEIADCAEALDGWLSRGGFLPDAWTR
jgi:hypothetical protein